MDGTQTQQDTSGKNQDSSQGKQGTPQTPRTFTEAEVQKQVSDALSKAGRDAKSLEKRETDIRTQLEKIAQWQKQRDMEADERLKGNPEALDWLQKKRQLQQEREALEREKAEHAELIKSANETKKEITLWEIAQKHDIDAGELKDACEELGLATKEQFEGVAKRMAKAGTKPPQTPLKPDSGKTTGGSRDTSSMSADEKLAEGFKRLNK